ncbi:MAG: gluconate 2-dehydrogenase subunit 3 family protein [Bryobacteraceae bacterium]
MADRRSALKILGAIGTSCAFPSAANELYGQHVHYHFQASAPPFAPRFFRADEMALVSRLADLIIPRTDTPGAVDAGVPNYIDHVIYTNKQHREVFRAGLRRIDALASKQYGRKFLALTEPEQIDLLTPLAEEADSGKPEGPDARFFRSFKSMTADGYYTSRTGLIEELGYNGNTVLAEFPACDVPES